MTVTGNAVMATSLGGALSHGVLVDTAFGDLENITVANNTVDMGTASTGNGIAVSSNDATPTGVSVQDNTVVYGHRDLRFRNTLDLPIGFSCEVDAGQVTLALCASRLPARRSIAFVAEPQASHTVVTTMIDGKPILRQRYQTAADA